MAGLQDIRPMLSACMTTQIVGTPIRAAANAASAPA
jgi:hypothetical protein